MAKKARSASRSKRPPSSAKGSLDEYRRKRRFSRTSEPKGKVQPSGSRLTFVIQKHDASRLHYDFRLEWDGVLKSWAVPKGPSLDPKEKRLAVQVEDHPLEYGGFEGIIPEGEYGGGTVVLWDRGTWTPQGDPAEGLRNGRLKFELHGDKLSGGWTLVRFRTKGQERANNWLLIKERDDVARSLEDYDVLEDQPKSVATGRTLDEVASDRDRQWSGNGEHATGAKSSTVKRKRSTRPAKKKARRKKDGVSLEDLPGAKAASLPERFPVALATLVSEAPEGDDWLCEIKFDGYRLFCRIENGKAKLFTRNHLDWTNRFAAIAKAAEKLPVENALLDGEVVVLESNGVSSFQALQTALSEGRGSEPIYYLFDALHLNGFDLRKVPLERRKQALQQLLEEGAPAALRYTEHIEGSGPEFFRQCCQMGLEGIIAKRRDRPYPRGRTGEWLKIKCNRHDEFVVGGFTEPNKSRQGLGSLLVGYYDKSKKLVFAGHVGTGFSDRLLLELWRRLNKLEQKESPFANLLTRQGARGTHWVEPELVAQVTYSNWTRDGMLRHPSFQGLREDKMAKTVTRDTPVAVEITDAKASDNDRNVRKGKRAKSAPDADGRNPIAGVTLTNPDRVLYAEQGITKAGLAAFYADIAKWILPHLTDRPLSLVRCPRGQGKACFFQKHIGPGMGESLRRVEIQEKEKSAEYSIVDDVAGLVELVQMGVLEIHPWGSRADMLERPDRLIFDLDPDESVPWTRVLDAAREARDLLADLGLASFVKTTGGKGLHVVAPIQRRVDWPEAKQFAKAVAEKLAASSPRDYTTNMSKAARKGKIFIDYLRNDRGATAIAAYSTRARPGAPVSVPLTWNELSESIRSDHFNVENLRGRLNALKEDPWKEFFETRQSITAAARKKVGL